MRLFGGLTLEKGRGRFCEEHDYAEVGVRSEGLEDVGDFDSGD